MRCMPQVVVRITDAQLAWLEGQVEQFRPKSVVVRDLIDSAMKGVDTFANLSAYHVGAGNLSNLQPKAQLPNEATNPIVPIAKSSSEPGEDFSLGEGVGKGSGETPRKPRFLLSRPCLLN